jgi:large conductance mechanosensitive channel protein
MNPLKSPQMKEFKKFISRGNVVDLAVGLVLATYFGAIVKSLVNDVIMPPVGILLGGVDFSDLKIVIKETKERLLKLPSTTALLSTPSSPF